MEQGQLGQHQKQQLEQLVLICLDTATHMLDKSPCLGIFYFV